MDCSYADGRTMVEAVTVTAMTVMAMDDGWTTEQQHPSRSFLNCYSAVAQVKDDGDFHYSFRS